MGVHRQSVNRWALTLAQSGRAGLKKAGRAGRKPLLSKADLRRIERALKRSPEAFGCETGLWTTKRVAELIEESCDVRYHPRHVWWILRRLGWSCQRPVGRALERDEAPIERWKKKRWPELKKSPQRGPHYSFHRRKWAERAASLLSYLVSERTDSRAAVSF